MTNFSCYTDEVLLETYHTTRERLASFQSLLGHLELEMIRRMEARGAVGIPDERFTCEMKVTRNYDQLSLAPLKEVFNREDLNHCFTPAHEEVVQVADKWDVRKVIPLAKRYGIEATRIVEKATLPGRRSLVFQRKME